MSKIKRILHPTDFSPASGAALARAIATAKTERAELLIVHVMSLTFPLMGDGYVSPKVYEEMEASSRAYAGKQLARVLARARKAGVRARTLLLSGVPYEQIDVVVHPQSIVHAMVHLNDGASLAHLGYPDMRVPISFALNHPDRVDVPVRPLDLVELGALTFEAPDLAAFPCLRLAREAAEAGGTAPCVLNAANEVAVHAFLAGDLSFTGIARVIESTLSELPAQPVRHFSDLFARDNNFHRKTFTAAAMEHMRQQHWRGNIRELRNFVERLMIMTSAEAIDVRDIPDANAARMDLPVPPGSAGAAPAGAPDQPWMHATTLQEFKSGSERAYLVSRLRENGWNISKTAEVIDTPRSNLYKKLEQYQISQEKDGSAAS